MKMSFSSRYGRGLEVIAILKSKQDYNSTRPEESLVNFQNFLESIHVINNTVTQNEEDTKVLTDARHALFNEGQGSVMRTFTALKSNVGWQYGFESTEYKLLDIIWNRMISSGIVSNATGEQTITEEPQDSEVKKSRKNSERTFSAMSKNFEDFIVTISGFQNYNPGPDKFKLENLNATLTTINDFNTQIADKKLKLDVIKKQRLSLYSELKDRTDRIKSNIRSQYGVDSDVFIRTNSLKF